MDKMNANTALAEALGLDRDSEPSTPTLPPPKPLIPRPIASNNQIDSDAEYARTNIFDIIEQGAKAIEAAQNLVYESMHPRSIEVLAQLLKVQSDNVDKLLKLHADKKKINAVDGESGDTNIEKAVIFAGTSDQLIREIRKENRNSINVIDIDVDTESE